MNTNLPKWSALVVASLAFISCEEDSITERDPGEGKVTVQFEYGARTIAESASEQVVTLTLSKPLVSDAQLTLKADDSFSENFTSMPAALNGVIKLQLSKGSTNATVKIAPVNNDEKDGNRAANLSFQSLSVPHVTGTHRALSITVTDDEGESPAESVANFIEQSITLEEKAASWIEYQVHFSEAVALDSEVKVSIASEKGTYGVDFLSEPAAQDHHIALQVTAGLRVIAFRVRPLDNDKITGDLIVNLSITETSGSIRKGNKLDQVLTIKDDELAGKPKGYEVTAGTDIVKRFYEYDEHGRVSKVHWQNYTPYLTQGTEIYHYDGSNQIIKIEKFPGKEVLYHWNNGRIAKSETIWNGALHNYSEYDYDDAGNIGGVVTYHRQPDGSYTKGFFTIYLYFTDGNLYKSMTYQDSNDPENPHLLSTRTYDNYTEVDNPFPMTEVLPNIKMQKTLATTYRVEDSTGDLLYHMTYEFREDGQPEKRIATSGKDVQTAVYYYY